MRKLRKIFGVVILSLIGISATGQSSDFGYSIGLKSGIGLFEQTYIEGIDLNVLTSKFIYSAAYNYHPELDILTPNPREFFHQLNLLFGSYVTQGSLRFDYQGGVGIVRGRRRTTIESSGFLVPNYHSKEFETIGIPVRVSIKYVPFNFMSIGFDMIVNVNPEKTFAAPMATLNFGRIIKNRDY